VEVEAMEQATPTKRRASVDLNQQNKRQKETETESNAVCKNLTTTNSSSDVSAVIPAKAGTLDTVVHTKTHRVRWSKAETNDLIFITSEFRETLKKNSMHFRHWGQHCSMSSIDWSHICAAFRVSNQ
jgi:hypothetical protein